MSIQSNYEINVAKDGMHYCKIQLSETFEDKAKEKLRELQKIFGDEYELDMTYWHCKGFPVE